MSIPSVPAEEPLLLIQKIAAPRTNPDAKTHPSATATRRPTFVKGIEKQKYIRIYSINMKLLI